MGDFNIGHVGRLVFAAGIILAVFGLLLVVLGRFGFVKLPGDVEFGGAGWKVYVPLASCVILSLLLTAVVWVVRFLGR
jgi:hypothetical protein